MQLDKTLGFQDQRVHEAITFALDSVLQAQFSNGAWPQGFREFPNPNEYPVKAASYPESWPREYPGGDYCNSTPSTTTRSLALTGQKR